MPCKCSFSWVSQDTSYCPLPTGSTFEAGVVEAYVFVKSIDYPRDPMTGEITAAIHPQLQVQYKIHASIIAVAVT